MQPKPNKGEGKKKNSSKWNKKCASNLQYSSATLIHPPVYVTMPFLIMGSQMGIFHGTPALAAPGGQLRQPSEGWGSMCRTSALHRLGGEASDGKREDKVLLKEMGIPALLLLQGSGMVLGKLLFMHKEGLDFPGPQGEG